MAMRVEKHDLYKPSERLFEPLELPQGRLLTGPGPSNCAPRVLRAAGQQVLGHLHPEFLEVMDTVKAGLRYVFQTTNSLTLAVSGTGHAGMEAAFVNVVEPGDRVLVLHSGVWGSRAREMAERCGARVCSLIHGPGQVFTLHEVAQGLQKYRPEVLFACQGESSSGLCQPLEGLGELCHRYDCLLLVDAVASLGGVPFFMDKWGVDVVYSGSQKVLGTPPGVAPISFSHRARAKMTSRKTKVQSFYLDMNWLAKYWGVDGQQRVYHHTAPINTMYAFREGLAMIAEEGLESSWKRHRENAELLWTGLEKLGLEMFIKDKKLRLPTINAVSVPSGVNWKELCSYAMKTHNVEIAGGLGPTVGKVGRIGLMGYNSSAGNAQRVLRVVEEGLQHCSRKMKASL